MKLIRYRTSVPTFNQHSLLGELDSLFEAGFPAANRALGRVAFPIDVFEHEHAVTVRSELPGFRKEDLSVVVAEDTLTITGRSTASEDAANPQADIVLERAITLPKNLRREDMTAAFENGVLTVTLPRREEVKPKTVAVEIK